MDLFKIKTTKFSIAVFRVCYCSVAKLVQNKKQFNLKNKSVYFSEFEDYNCPKDEPSDVRRKTSANIFLSKSIKKRKVKTLPFLQYKGELLFGVHPVYLALLKNKRVLLQLFLRNDKELTEKTFINKRKEIEKMAVDLGLSIRKIDSAVMKHLVPNAVHQGVCLDTGPYPLLEWIESETGLFNANGNSLPFWLILEEILDPMNVGAIVRSAHYFGIDKIFVAKENSCRLSPIVSKASSGALEVMNVYQLDNLENFLKIRRNQGWNIIASVVEEVQNELSNSVMSRKKFEFCKPTIFILGNESRGIRNQVLKLCNNYASIRPYRQLHYGIDSLNVSVAAGVMLHELSKARLGKKNMIVIYNSKL